MTNSALKKKTLIIYAISFYFLSTSVRNMKTFCQFCVYFVGGIGGRHDCLHVSSTIVRTSFFISNSAHVRKLPPSFRIWTLSAITTDASVTPFL